MCYHVDMQAIAQARRNQLCKGCLPLPVTDYMLRQLDPQRVQDSHTAEDPSHIYIYWITTYLEMRNAVVAQVRGDRESQSTCIIYL